MFQPFNESFVRSTVEATIDHHIGESEEERALREGKSYQPNSLTFQAQKFLLALGHLLLCTGKRLKDMGARNTPLVQQRGTSR
jgi:hypothetical protein